MKIIGVIPARFKSSRFPGKPLAEICGKPMLWWVYNSVKRIGVFSDVFCAIDDERIQKVCDDLNLKYVMTRNDHPNHFSRIQEVSDTIRADYYICINGDEPLIAEECILPVVPSDTTSEPYLGGGGQPLSKPLFSRKEVA